MQPESACPLNNEPINAKPLAADLVYNHNVFACGHYDRHKRCTSARCPLYSKYNDGIKQCYGLALICKSCAKARRVTKAQYLCDRQHYLTAAGDGVIYVSLSWVNDGDLRSIQQSHDVAKQAQQALEQQLLQQCLSNRDGYLYWNIQPFNILILVEFSQYDYYYPVGADEHNDSLEFYIDDGNIIQFSQKFKLNPKPNYPLSVSYRLTDNVLHEFTVVNNIMDQGHVDYHYFTLSGRYVLPILTKPGAQI